MRRINNLILVIAGITIAVVAIFSIGCNTGHGVASEKNIMDAKDGNNSTEPSEYPVGADGQIIVDEQTRLEVLEAHCKTIEGFYLGGPTIQFDKSGPRLPMEEIPGALALEPAAAFYSILTLDFDVSLSDVVEAGLWPYDIFDNESYLDMKLYDFPWCIPIASKPGFELVVKEKVGSPEWYMKCRNQILQHFYTEYYFDSWGLISDYTNLPGEPIFQFWDFEQLPAESFGYAGKYLGEVLTVPAERFRMSLHDKVPVYELDVLWVNYISTGETAESSTLDSKGTISDVKNVSETLDCCLFKLNAKTWDDGLYGNYHKICCECTSEETVCCEYWWDYEETTFAEWYTFAGCWDCDDSPPAGYIKRTHGQRAPNTTIVSFGSASSVVIKCDPETACVFADPGCKNAQDNFASSLYIGQSVTFPGPICTQCGKSGSSLTSYGGCCGPKVKKPSA